MKTTGVSAPAGPTPTDGRAADRAGVWVRNRWAYRRAVRERRARHPGLDGDPRAEVVPGRSLAEVLADIDRNGYTILEHAVDPAGLEQVQRELDRAIATDRVLPVLRGARKPDEPKQLTAEECRRGDEYIRPRAFIVYVADPLLDCPSALPYAFSELVANVAQGVYGCPAALTASKVMRSYANDLPLIELNWFHFDNQARRILKFFMYLHDVEPGGGAFCYVAGSHRRKPRGIVAPSHLTDADAAAFYGAGALRELTAKRGSVVIADTAGYHRAGKPTDTDRNVLLVATGVHPFHTPVRVPRSYVDGLDPLARALADFSVIVDDGATAQAGASRASSSSSGANTTSQS